MALGFFFGFPFIAIGLAPEGKPINLVVGTPIFVFFVALALWDLGHRHTLILEAARLQGVLFRRHFHRRERIEFAFADLLRLVLVKSRVVAGGRHSSKAEYFDLLLELRDGRSLKLPMGRRADAPEAAAQVGRILELPVNHESRFGSAP